MCIRDRYQLGQETAAMQWPEWIYGSFVPVGAAFSMIAFIEGIINMYKEMPPADAGNGKEKM